VSVLHVLNVHYLQRLKQPGVKRQAQGQQWAEMCSQITHFTRHRICCMSWACDRCHLIVVGCIEILKVIIQWYYCCAVLYRIMPGERDIQIMIYVACFCKDVWQTVADPEERERESTDESAKSVSLELVVGPDWKCRLFLCFLLILGDNLQHFVVYGLHEFSRAKITKISWTFWICVFKNMK